MTRVERGASATRQFILDSTIELLGTRPSDTIRVSDIAAYSHVGIPTIYYYFASRDLLISEAQVENFRRLITRRHAHLDRMRDALDSNDQAAWNAALHDYHVANASPVTFDTMWDLVRVLADIRTNPAARRRFVEIHDGELLARARIVERAQQRGWLRSDVDARAYVALSGTVVIGRILLEGSEHFDIDPEAMHALQWSFIGPPVQTPLPQPTPALD